MSIKQLWQSFTGTDHVKQAAKSLAGKGGEPEPRDVKKDAAASASSGASANVGSF